MHGKLGHQDSHHERQLAENLRPPTFRLLNSGPAETPHGHNSREAGTPVIEPRLLHMAKPLLHQLIARALEIISDETKWTRCSMARMADGKVCASLDPAAASFCAVGALYRAAAVLFGADGFNRALEAEEFVLTSNKSNVGLQIINDTEGREAVIAMFEVALAN